MQINLWRNEAMNQWRWTLLDPNTLDMESGQREDLKEAMKNVVNTVEYLLTKKLSKE